MIRATPSAAAISVGPSPAPLMRAIWRSFAGVMTVGRPRTRPQVDDLVVAVMLRDAREELTAFADFT